MLKSYISKHKILEEVPLDNKEESLWINLVAPTVAELQKVEDYTGVSLDALKVALDEDESSYMEMEDNYLLVVISIPIQSSDEDKQQQYVTLPVAIILTENCIITVCAKPCLFVDQIIKSLAVSSLAKRTRFFFQILHVSATNYIKYLKVIIKQSNEAESALRKSTANREFFQLIDLQKSLTFFTTALQNNAVVFEKISRFKTFYTDVAVEDISVYQQISINRNKFLKIYEEDKELLEDVLIENKQAMDMVNTYSNILAGMLDALAGIIGNNLARIFKVLTLMALIISVPNLVSSMWGMNVQVPWEGEKIGFYIVPIFQLSATLFVTGLLWKLGFFKK